MGGRGEGRAFAPGGGKEASKSERALKGRVGRARALKGRGRTRGKRSRLREGEGRVGPARALKWREDTSEGRRRARCLGGEGAGASRGETRAQGKGGARGERSRLMADSKE
eukprot:2056084-Pleurochrysis_carterae.AAC.1